MNWLLAIAGILAVLYYIDQNGGSVSDAIDLGTNQDGGTVGNLTTSDLADAIAQQEGVDPSHNNPYALTAGAAEQVGADYTPNTTGGVVVNFPTIDAGIAAGQAFVAQFVQDHSNLSLSQALATYILGPNSSAVQTGNYPQSVLNYIGGVASALGVSAHDTLASIFGS
jgi:hypothetical protein